ncbi:MAG: M48 family metalloprotease [Alphaproteobacteria bacterium]|nr:M48 family metalloprotease [Alphaproteobacteria bacterium]
MPARLLLISTATLGLLLGSVLALVFTFALLAGASTLQLLGLSGIGVAFMFANWLFGPLLFDLVQGWFYEVEQLEFDQFERRFPVVGRFMRQVCEREGMPVPQIRILRDDNPTAFTYGSLPWNARVAFSAGLFRFLDDDEVCAVAAHELGHVRHYDFLVMTLAQVLLMLLYEVYFWARYADDGEERDARLWVVALAAYVAWWIGYYLVQWLSRTREYMADAFAAEQLGDQRPLQRSLVKIAYGLAELQVKAERSGTKRNDRLLQSTRALGIADPKSAGTVGNAIRTVETMGSLAVETEVAHDHDGTDFRPELIEPVFLFDLYNPWATVVELDSTHPLTGKRLRALDDLAEGLHRPRLFRFDAIDAAGKQLDQGALYGDFAFEVVLWFLPWILPVMCIPLYVMLPGAALGIGVAAFGFGAFARAAYSYAFLADFEATTVYELMCDPYASPLRGRPVELEGTIMGKADAGSRFSEDAVLKDRSGALITMDYQSPIPVFGNLWFGWSTVRDAVGRPAKAKGWFRRGMSQYVDLYDVSLNGSTYGSFNRMWALLTPVGAMLLGAVLVVAGLMVDPQFDLGGDDAPVDDVPRTSDGVEVW